jgi:aspartyl-tRNA(Asn)/glutamyl-tRNA(Gln) amidotransferase subunit A
MYLQDIFTVHANLSGNPAISIPFGIHSNGMPFGLQLMSDRFNEKQLFSYSKLLKNYL